MSDFWSRRRAAVQAEEQAEQVALRVEAEAAQEAQQAERSDEELLQEAGLPEPENIDSPEQVQEFLKSALPQRLKTRALRKLWTMNPVLANLDGLVDYGEDFTDAATVVENLQTVYQVGKGMVSKLEELLEDSDAPEIESDEEDAPEDLPVALADLPADPAPLPEPEPEEFAALPPTARRMRFRFEAEG
jgi:hypothetical protein